MVRPTREELDGAADASVDDVIGPGLRVLFCGINPSLWSAAVNAHFAHPSNRFWKVLRDAGVTDRLLAPDEGDALLAAGLGVTNLVPRATRSAKELGAEELRDGGAALEAKVRRYGPVFVAVVGAQAYRSAFRRPRAAVGRQDGTLGGSGLWVLPNPSGLQAHYQHDDLVDAYRQLRRAARAAP